MKAYAACFLAFFFLTGTLAATEQQKASKTEAKAVPQDSILKTDEQKLSYAMGIDLGEYFKSLDDNFDLDMLMRGIGDGYHGKTPLLGRETIVELQQEFGRRQQEREIKKMVALIEKNRKAAEDFLKENKKKTGVVETSSGLQYKVLKAGSGALPKGSDTVKVHYTGSLLDGTEFDSSYSRNEAAIFRVEQVIPGWQEVLSLMPAGSKYEAYLPPDLAYGNRGVPPEIDPGSLLIFQVELLEVNPKIDEEVAEQETDAEQAQNADKAGDEQKKK